MTVDASYDGDGQQYKRVETKQTNSQQPSSETKFFLRSSVLGGQVVTEYDGLGARQKSYVSGGGAVITSSPSAGLIWRFNNPVTGDGRETDGLGKVTTGSYLDPEGVDVRVSDPASTQGEPPPLDTLPQAGAYSAYLPRSMGGSGRCSFNGMETGCALVNSLLASGAADQCLDNDCGPQNVTVIARDRAGQVVGRTTVTVHEGDPGWNGSLDGFYDGRNPGFFDPSRAFALAFLRSISRSSGIFEGEGALRREEALDPQNPCGGVNADGEGGQGWYRYPNRGKKRIDYGQPGVVAALTNLASAWNLKHPNHPLGIGDLSQFGGGFNKMHPSEGHKNGVIVDLRPIRQDGAQQRVTYHSPDYDRALTQELVNDLLALTDQKGSLVTEILFNDAKVIGVTRVTNDNGVHDNHLHVEFRSGIGCP